MTAATEINHVNRIEILSRHVQKDVPYIHVQRDVLDVHVHTDAGR
jgi:hypothetical protein